MDLPMFNLNYVNIIYNSYYSSVSEESKSLSFSNIENHVVEVNGIFFLYSFNCWITFLYFNFNWSSSSRNFVSKESVSCICLSDSILKELINPLTKNSASN